MEDVLLVYARPDDAARPVVCLELPYRAEKPINRSEIKVQ